MQPRSSRELGEASYLEFESTGSQEADRTDKRSRKD